MADLVSAAGNIISMLVVLISVIVVFAFLPIGMTLGYIYDTVCAVFSLLGYILCKKAKVLYLPFEFVYDLGKRFTAWFVSIRPIVQLKARFAKRSDAENDERSLSRCHSSVPLTSCFR